MAAESEVRVRAIRIRLIGRRWKLSFMEDLARALRGMYGDDATVRINSFIAQGSRLPILDFDLIPSESGQAEDLGEKINEVRRAVEDVLAKHKYPMGRLLSVKEVEVRLGPGEQARQEQEGQGEVEGSS